LEGLKPGDRIRLKDLCNIEFVSMGPLKARYVGTEVESSKGKKMKIIHWAPVNGLPIRVMGPEKTDEGIGEAGIASELGKVVQFERYGFVKINCLGEPIVACFTHR
jgi:glutamyl-tRNA synthetase